MLAGRHAAVFCQHRGQDLRELHQILHVCGSQKLGDLAITVAHPIDIKAVTPPTSIIA